MTPTPVKIILTDFRHDLESFYQRLQLTPPYDSVEKALTCLSTLMQTKTADEQQHIADNKISKWKLYQIAIIDSGLYKKHRGIIAGLLRSQNATDIPEVQRYLQEPFLETQAFEYKFQSVFF